MLWLVGAAIICVEIFQRISTPHDQLWQPKANKRHHHWSSRETVSHERTSHGTARREISLDLLTTYVQNHGHIPPQDSEGLQNFDSEDIRMLESVLGSLKIEWEHRKDAGDSDSSQSGHDEHHATESPRLDAPPKDEPVPPRSQNTVNRSPNNDPQSEGYPDSPKLKRIEMDHRRHNPKEGTVHDDVHKRDNHRRHGVSTAAEDAYLGKNPGPGRVNEGEPQSVD